MMVAMAIVATMTTGPALYFLLRSNAGAAGPEDHWLKRFRSWPMMPTLYAWFRCPKSFDKKVESSNASTGQVAQLVEHRTENPGVGSSILPLSTQWSASTDLFLFPFPTGPIPPSHPHQAVCHLFSKHPVNRRIASAIKFSGWTASFLRHQQEIDGKVDQERFLNFPMVHRDAIRPFRSHSSTAFDC
jgi:hypothetical protein